MLEVRTGPGLEPLYRGVQPTGTVKAVEAEARSILQKTRGPEGDRKRRNAESLRDKWKEEWGEGGEALKNLRRFLTDCCNGSGCRPLYAPQVPNQFGSLFNRNARL
jgi:hypothetical protein